MLPGRRGIVVLGLDPLGRAVETARLIGPEPTADAVLRLGPYEVATCISA